MSIKQNGCFYVYMGILADKGCCNDDFSIEV